MANGTQRAIMAKLEADNEHDSVPEAIEGVPRALYSLIGAQTPSLAVQLNRPEAKPAERGESSKPRWERRAFRNGVRNDSLELSHWVRAEADINEEYAFAKYNTNSLELQYTDEEYTELLTSEEWSREETDYLFALMHDYDHRWFVVHDRYDFRDGPERSLEDLKDRYCSVHRKLIRTRDWTDEGLKAMFTSAFGFEREKELMRRKYNNSLAARSAATVAEEDALQIVFARFSQRERRARAQRHELLRTLAGVTAGLADLPLDDDGLLGASSGGGGTGVAHGGGGEKKRKRMPESPMVPPTPVGGGSSAPRRKTAVANAEYDSTNCITRALSPPDAHAPKTSHAPAFLRSYKLHAPRPPAMARTAGAFSDAGVPVLQPNALPPAEPAGKTADARALHGVAAVLALTPPGSTLPNGALGGGAWTVVPRLVMPTRANAARLEALVERGTQLAELRRLVERTEEQIASVQVRMAGGSVSQRATPVDGDGDEEDEARGRQRRMSRTSRRSMSVSSVDTSVTASTVAGRKRSRK